MEKNTILHVSNFSKPTTSFHANWLERYQKSGWWDHRQIFSHNPSDIRIQFWVSIQYHGLCPQDVGWGFFQLGTLNSVVDSLLKITNFGSLGVSCCSPAVATTKNGWLSHPTCRLLSASAQTTSWHHGRLLLAACLLENCITQRIFPIRRLGERPKSKTSCITSGFLGDLSFVLPEKDVPLENCQGGQDPAVSYNRIAESSWCRNCGRRRHGVWWNSFRRRW